MTPSNQSQEVVGTIDEPLFSQRLVPKLIEERDQLKAHVERLREALQSVQNCKEINWQDTIKVALNSTPSQSLAEYRNKVVEKVALPLAMLVLQSEFYQTGHGGEVKIAVDKILSFYTTETKKGS